MKLLVTGGTGFIGNHVVQHLLNFNKETEITCFTRQNISSTANNLKYIQLDLRDLKNKDTKFLYKEIGKVDSIIYLGASIPLANEKKEDMITAKENNLDPFLYFLEAFGNLTNKIIFTSTTDIYGSPDKINFTEDTPVKPTTTYAISKYACEKYLEFYCNLNKKTHIILRLAQIYGPNEPQLRVLSFILDAVLNNKEFTLSGSGGDKRKFLYVKDVASAITLSLNYSKNNTFNIAGSEEVSILEAIRIVEKVANRKIKVKQINPEKEPIHILPNCDRAYKELGFKPEYSFEEGIKDILNKSLKIAS